MIKTKSIKTNIISFVIMIAVIMIFGVTGIATMTAFAGDEYVTVGSFQVKGDESGYTYESGTLIFNRAGEYTVKNTDPETATADNIEIHAENVVLTMAGVNIKRSNPAMELYAGNHIIILAENTVNTLDSSDGIFYAGLLSKEYSLTIRGEGTLIAKGGQMQGAGIGGSYDNGVNNGNAGNITIEGGVIEATGGNYAAGIGGSMNGSVSNITVSGGTVTAIGGEYGAGIGGGMNGSVSNITVSGGTVTATGGVDCAGIGGGLAAYSNGTLSSGENGSAIVQASSINANTADFVDYIEKSGTSYTVHGNVTLSADLTIDEGETLTVPEGATLTVPEGVTLTNNGTITNNGTLNCNNHNYQNGVCTICGVTCTHSFDTNGVCTICGVTCTHSFDTDGVCTECGVAKNIQVTVGETTVTYVTLSEAFDAVMDAGRATIKLLDDVKCTENDGYIQLWQGNVTLDLAGYTLELAGLSVYGAAELTITDSGENGELNTPVVIAAEAGRIVIEDGSYDGVTFAVMSDGSAPVIGLEIKGGDFGNVEIAVETGTALINGGSFDKATFMVGDGDIFLLGGTFENGISATDLSGAALSLSYVLHDTDCLKYYGADGELLEDIDFEASAYEGYLKVEHNGAWYSQSNTEMHVRHCVSCEMLDLYGYHSGSEATCASPSFCDGCGMILDAVNHFWDDNDVCEVCGSGAPVVVIVEGVETAYTSVSDAFSAAMDAESAKVKLLSDVLFDWSVSGYVDLSEGNITLDLAGYTLYSVGLSVYGNATLTIVDSSENGAGRLVCTENMIYIQDDGRLIIEGGNYGTVVIWVDTSSLGLEISGGKFDEAGIAAFGGLAIINGGEFGSAQVMLGGGTAYVFGGTFENGILAVDENNEAVSLKYILSDEACASYYGADGTLLNMDFEALVYEGYVRVVHNGEYAYAHNEMLHWLECTVCRFEYGEAGEHTGGTATCLVKAVCEVCHVSYGDFADHTGNAENCLEQAVCTVCNEPFDGYGPHKLGTDGSCELCAEAIVFSVETADGVFYCIDLAEAIGKAEQYATAKITLLGNYAPVSGSEHYEIYGNITLDLAGYTLKDVVFDIFYGQFTVEDSSEDGTGTITSETDTDYYAFGVSGGGTLIINGGNIDAAIWAEGYNRSAPATVVIGGGVFTGAYGVDIYEYSEVYVSGGTFDCEYEEFYFGASSVKLVISGGVFPNGLEIEGGNVADALSSVGCLYYVDEDGNKIAAELLDTEYYEGYIEVAHFGEYAYAHDETVHWLACTSCGLAEGEAEAHTGGTATCTQGALCDVCGAEYGTALGHSWNEGAVTTQPTCTEKGVKTFTCQNDSSHTYTEDVDALGHNYGTAWGTDANEHWNVCSCGATGNRAAHDDSDDNGKCDICEYEISGTVTVEPDSAPAPTDDNDGLSGGAIAGIVVGSVLVVGLGGFSLFWFVIKKKRWADLIGIFKK